MQHRVHAIDYVERDSSFYVSEEECVYVYVSVGEEVACA